mmetsp:Transcript_3694/g.9666  ORF Transcript_3694/g.9666 Transcript_3694/m.9666 type:complete len:520 (+) Transcript_3694:162-1721(+)
MTSITTAMTTPFERGSREQQQHQQQQLLQRLSEAPPENEPDDRASGESGSDDQEADRILARELLRLSFKERTMISEEIHGVRDAFPESKETPETVQLALLAMEDAMDSMIPGCGFWAEDVPQSRALRLAFLRCELFDAAKAARRMLNHVRVVRKLSFSPSGMGRGGRIVASAWFSRDEYAALRTGAIQLLPFRDRSGRRILVVWSACFKMLAITRLKIVLYLISGASEDVESQKKGFVIMIWPGDCDVIKPTNDGIMSTILDGQVVVDVQAAFSLRIVCVHFGYERSRLLSLARRFVVRFFQHKTRLNIITGSNTELNYKIMGFGIHPSMLPIAINGTVKNKNHLQWLEARERIEQEPYGSFHQQRSRRGAVVECPSIHDVLFHRGKSCQYHPGNVWFKGMLESKKDRHRSANQTAKSLIAWELVEEVEGRSGRFLHWDNRSGWWVEFEDPTEVRHKVATALRDFGKRNRAAANRQNTHSGTSFFASEKGHDRKRRRNDGRGEDGGSSSDCSCETMKCP